MTFPPPSLTNRPPHAPALRRETLARRIMAAKNNDAHASASYWIRKPNERERDIQRLIVLFQMIYVGAPMIYYGEKPGCGAGTNRMTGCRWLGPI